MTLKMAVLAPTPSAMVMAAVRVKTGLLRRARVANRRSWRKLTRSSLRSGGAADLVSIHPAWWRRMWKLERKNCGLRVRGKVIDREVHGE